MNQLEHLTALDFTGADARDFLHRQLSADILALGVGETTFACLCVPKGRVTALMLVEGLEDGARVILSAALADSVATGLGRFIFRDKVRISAVEGVVIGSDAPFDGAVAPLPGLHYGRSAEASASPDAGAFLALELEHGVAWLDGDTRDEFLPQALGFERIGALNFRKGCYPGQEIVARTRYLGRLKRRAVLVSAPGIESLAPMSRLLLSGDGVEAKADLVATAPGLAFAVARTADEFSVSSVSFEEQAWSVDRAEWAPPAQASATR